MLHQSAISSTHGGLKSAKIVRQLGILLDKCEIGKKIAPQALFQQLYYIAQPQRNF